MTSERHPGTAPVFKLFRELSALPPEERREALMVRLEHIWDQAQSRTYVTKKGDEYALPDGTLQLKVVQAVAVLQGMAGEPPEDAAAKLARMTDGELVKEAMKRLPAADVERLADALIEVREQQRASQAIVTTGETTDAPEKQRSSKRKRPDAAHGQRAAKPERAQTEGGIADSSDSDTWG